MSERRIASSSNGDGLALHEDPGEILPREETLFRNLHSVHKRQRMDLLELECICDGLQCDVSNLLARQRDLVRQKHAAEQLIDTLRTRVVQLERVLKENNIGSVTTVAERLREELEEYRRQRPCMQQPCLSKNFTQNTSGWGGWGDRH